MKKIKLAKEILLSILDSSSEFCELFWDARRYQKAMATGGREYVAAIKSSAERKRLRDELIQLKKRKFLEQKKIGGKLVFCLTDKGRMAALRHKMTENKKILSNGYCIVIFDVPESERRIRNFFRSFLKESGFKQLQKSVWFTKNDISDDVVQLVRSADAERWIRVISATSISNL